MEVSQAEGALQGGTSSGLCSHNTAESEGLHPCQRAPVNTQGTGVNLTQCWALKNGSEHHPFVHTSDRFQQREKVMKTHKGTCRCLHGRPPNTGVLGEA